MITGEIVGEPSPDRQGDTLAAEVVATDTVLSMAETAVDFDRDGSGGWLKIGESEPLAYASVDTDADTVTLAAPLADGYEAGLPVTLWDPTVPPSGAQVVDYVAEVRLHDGSGSPDVVIPHELIPLNGVDNLVGASVGVVEDDAGEWYVERVYGRTAVLDGSTISSPSVGVYLTSDYPIESETWRRIPWPSTQGNTRVTLTDDAKLLTITQSGRYLIIGAVVWESLPGGVRRGRIVLVEPDDTELVLRETSLVVADSTGSSRFQVVVSRVLTEGQRIALDLRQKADGLGTVVDAVGDATGTSTAMEIVRISDV